MTTNRYDLAPLAAVLGIELFDQGEHRGNVYDLTSGARALADMLDVTKKSIDRWKRDGIPARRADELACQHHRHPSSIWPAWFLDTEPGDEQIPADDPPLELCPVVDPRTLPQWRDLGEACPMLAA